MAKVERQWLHSVLASGESPGTNPTRRETLSNCAGVRMTRGPRVRGRVGLETLVAEGIEFDPIYVQVATSEQFRLGSDGESG